MARWRRRILLGLVVVFAVVALAAVTLPWWLPLAVRVVARSQGIEFRDWETQGWSAIVYQDVVIDQPGFHATIDELRLPVLGVWPNRDSPGALTAEQLALSFRPVPPSGEPSPAPSIPTIMRSILGVWPQLEQWLPSADVNAIHIESGATPIEVSAVTWDGSVLRAVGIVPGRTEEVAIALARPEENALDVAATVAALEMQIELSAHLQDSTVTVAGEAVFRGNQAAVSAVFDESDLLPQTATLVADNISLPAEMLRMDGYGPVNGSVDVAWEQGSFEAVVHAEAQPASTDRPLTPVLVDLRATGDRETLQIEAADVQLRGVDAQLSSPLAIDLRTAQPQSSATFFLDVALDELPWSIGSGQLTGEADIAAGEAGGPPEVTFELSGTDLDWTALAGREVVAETFAAAGLWRPTELRIDRLTARLPGESSIEASLQLDLDQQQIAAANAQIDVAAVAVRPWLEGVPDFARLVVEVDVSGPYQAPQHSGSLAITGLQLRPETTIDADATWESSDLFSGTMEGEIIANPENIHLPFAVTAERQADGAIAIVCERLSWSDDAGPWWNLAEAATVTVRPAAAAGAPALIEVSNLSLRGEGVALDVAGEFQWPQAARLEVSSAGFDPSRLAPLLPEAGYGVRIDNLDLSAHWDNGPATVEGTLRASYTPNENSSYAVEAAFRTTGENSAATSLRVLEASGVVLEGEGEIPVEIAGTPEGFRFTLPRDGPLAMTLQSTANPVFWDSLADLTGWEIDQPEVTAELSGSLAEPRGRVDFRAQTVRAPDDLGPGQLPLLTGLRFVATADDAGVAVTNGVVAVEGRWVTLRGRIPWSAWAIWRAEQRMAWRRTEFALASEPMPMEIISRIIPTVLARDGQMSFEMEHAPERGFSGRMWLHQAATRPIAPLQTIRDIDGEVTLDGYALQLEKFVAYVGGRPIEVAGTANIERRSQPIFDFTITSSRVPVVRDQGVVLRASLDLVIEQTAEQPAHISGSVDLGSSVFVSDLGSLLPTGGVSAPEQRPPYFSVAEEPFANWTLAVTVAGEEFMRIENPLFRGTLSANFDLEGTLASPRAIGRVWSSSGQVIFPFGSVPIEQLEITLSPENPYQPQLLVFGSTRLYGFDIRMEVSGSASDPRLSFSSNPPASSQQIFLLLTTGQVPSADGSESFSTEERARRLALFIGRALARDFGIGGGEGDERLIVRSGEDFSEEGGETYYVQYNLDGSWSLVGEYDRFDAYNAGIKYRLIER